MAHRWLSALKLFRLRREELLPACVFLLIILVFHALIISKFWVLFADYYHADSWRIFMRNYHMSGFDPISYHVLTDWHQGFNLLRHPLLAYMFYPLYLLNQLLWTLTGANCAQLVMAAVLLFCGFYSFIFMHRILRDVIGLNRMGAAILTFFFFGCAYILLSLIVADHFAISLFLLLLTVYFAGRKMKAGRTFSRGQMWLLFVLTAGVTLSNGIIVWLCVWLTNGRSFFRLCTFVPAVLLSCLLLGLGFYLSTKYTSDEPSVVTSWVDTQTPRIDTLVENFFGESIQLHRSQLLGDVLMKRPVIVRYTNVVPYIVEAVIVLLFLVGIWRGRRKRFLHLLMACFAYAILLHLVVGFAINEVYIMVCHWLWVVPLTIAYNRSASHVPSRRRDVQRFAESPSLWGRVKDRLFHLSLLEWLGVGLTLYLWIRHAIFLYPYLTWPLSF